MFTYELSTKYYGIGISNGLERGLLVFHDGHPLIDEGMGIGACSVKKDGYTYFSSIVSIMPSGSVTQVELSLDKMLMRTIWGIHSKPLTWLIERTCRCLYQRNERNQGLLFTAGGLINRLLRIEVDYVRVQPIGKMSVIYRIDGDIVRVHVSGQLIKPVEAIYVMNEMSGAIFDAGIVDSSIVQPPSGWQKVKKDCRLYSKFRDISFHVAMENPSADTNIQLYWGRETDHEHCWAGFIYELPNQRCGFNGLDYIVTFQEGNGR
jgi:hypothetical protein